MTVAAGENLVSWTEVEDIDLVVVRRMREYMSGAHPSVLDGQGYEFVGLRDWEPGDRLSSIDWSQSTLNNFSPLVTRDFEQQSTATIVIIGDISLSTRCGANGVSIATVIARTVGTLALAAAFFQDKVGLVTFDVKSRQISVRPRIGKNHAIHCLEAYQDAVLGRRQDDLSRMEQSFAGLLRQTSMVPFVSDFLFDGYETVLDELSQLHAVHDVFVVLVDSRYAFELPALSSGWIETVDVETGEQAMLSGDDLTQLSTRVASWQDAVEAAIKQRGLEVLRLQSNEETFHQQLVDFLATRRMRK